MSISRPIVAFSTPDHLVPQAEIDRRREWAALRRAVFKRDDYTCAYCGQRSRQRGRGFHCDHVIPVCQGGSDDISNLTTACPSCNLEKGGKTPEQWRALQAMCRESAGLVALARLSQIDDDNRRARQRTKAKHKRAKQHVCPECDAPSGAPCVGSRGQARKALHSARLKLGAPRR